MFGSSEVPQGSWVDVMTPLDFDRSIAVVIGIDQYGSGIPPLRNAVSDARAIAKLLAEEHGYEVKLLLDGQATKQQLQVLVQEVLSGLLTKRSRLLFYFAGHGIAQDGDDGPAGYLIPQDASSNVVESYLLMRWLHDELIELPCKHFLAIFDCCFAGAFEWSKGTRDIGRGPKVIHQERFARFQQDPAWQVITSASYDQEAWDSFQLKDARGQESATHSPFAVALMQALQGAADTSPPAMNGRPAGDGVITATELYLYVRDQVEIPTSEKKKRQTPKHFPLRHHGNGEFIFLTPGHKLNLPPAPDLKTENNPYRGLESFDQEHAELFFGRNDEIEQLTARVLAMPPESGAEGNKPEPPKQQRWSPLTIVLGASGTGKSSLVKAGLLPRLEEKDETFVLLPVIRPGEQPLEALTRPIAKVMSVGNARVLRQQLETDELAVATLIENWQKQNGGKMLVLVVDQAEELVTQCREESEAKQFQRLLTRALEKHGRQFRVVVTLRLDFEAQFQQEEWKSVWMASRFMVPPMSQAQLREAIEKPAAERVLYFEPSSLVDRLVEDVGHTPGALPLLSFTLSELYLRYLARRSDNRTLTEADYEALGGVTGSLTQRATQEYEAFAAEGGADNHVAYERTVKNVMLRMVAMEGGELARRRVPLSELMYSSEAENGRGQRLLNRLIAARLVVQGQEGEEEPYVEPAHDALVRGWDKLLRWKNEEQVSLVLQRELTPQARNWQVEREAERRKKARGFLWDGDPRLGLLKDVLDSETGWLNAVETKFIKRSLERKRNIVRQIFGTGLVVIVALSGLTVFAFSQAGRANDQERIAKDNAAEAQKNADEAKDNLGEAQRQKQIAQDNADKAEEQTVIAQEAADRANKQTKVAEEQRDLAEKRQKEAEGARNAETEQRQIAEEETKRARYQESVARLQAQTTKVLNWIPTPIRATKGLVSAIATVEQSEKLADPEVMNKARASLLSAIQIARERNRLTEHTGYVLSVAMSWDGSTIVSGSWDSKVQLWDRQGNPIGKPFEGHTNAV